MLAQSLHLRRNKTMGRPYSCQGEANAQIMRRHGLSFLLGVALVIWAGVASGQTNPATPPIAKRPAVVAPVNNAPADRANVPPRPNRPPAAPAGMQDLVRDFQAARQAYIKQQHELNLQLAKATEEQRAAIRAQLKETLQQWRELQKQQVRESREQAKDIKNTLNLRDVIDSGSGDGRGR